MSKVAFNRMKVVKALKPRFDGQGKNVTVKVQIRGLVSDGIWFQDILGSIEPTGYYRIEYYDGSYTRDHMSLR